VKGTSVGAFLAGTGNRFLLVDGILGPSPDDPAALARESAARDPRHPDGVLLLDREGGGRLRMTVFNRDGSRPEACGNGLRCAAHYAVGAGHASGPELELVTDAGPRRARVLGSQRVEVSMGAARVGPRLGLRLDGEALEGAVVDLGNPHLVLAREALRDREVLDWGPRLERDPRFPHGTNVEFVVAHPDHLRLRVWERGVGETAACGSGACAAAAVLAPGGRWPVRVVLPGGELEVDLRDGELWLTGGVERLGPAWPTRC